MAQLDSLDIIVLVVLLVATGAYLTRGIYWGVNKDPFATNDAYKNVALQSEKTRNIVEKMADMGKNCVVFYGSQTGTAEDYASRLAKEGKSRFGLETMVADLEDYDFETLDTFPEDKVAIFVLATYGEGEPTDNAVSFYQFITGEPPEFSLNQEPALENLKFVAFGLGNKTYEHYNSMVRNVTAALEKHGAHRIGAAGEGDDGAGTMEEDFLAWKDPMWATLAQTMGLEEREAVYEPTFSITETDTLTKDSPEVYLGEPNLTHLQGTPTGPFNAHNPYIAPISTSKELFDAPDRNCLHLEVDISGSNLGYQTGDHIAVWPTNANREVDRFLEVTGLLPKRDTVIHVKPLDPTAKLPFPTPSTYDAVARYYMEINGAVSRQFIASLALFAPTPVAKAEMIKLGSDKEYFQTKVTSRYLNIAQVFEDVSGNEKWTAVPFSALMEGLNKLQPRYYSISSSSLVEKSTISITAIVESINVNDRSDKFKGVATNYLLALKQRQHDSQSRTSGDISHNISGPRNSYDGSRVPIYIRHSNFKLPSDPSKPVVMVGPGTGVAPFRAFVRERVALAKAGENVGCTILFFGCRRQDEDFLYKDEWEVRLHNDTDFLPYSRTNLVQEYKGILGDKFLLVTAFSREGTAKIYVQDRLSEYAEEINDVLGPGAGYFYVCGDAANMAKAVNNALVKVISGQRSITEAKAEEIVKHMRSSNHYQEDVW